MRVYIFILFIHNIIYMPQRNGVRSMRYRSAIARSAMSSVTGKTNSMMPSVLV